jgi:serine/threonine protein kinase
MGQGKYYSKKREVTTKIEQLKKKLRNLKEAEEKCRYDVQELEVANKRLLEEHYAEKKILLERNKVLKNDLRARKLSSSRLKKRLDTKVKAEDELRKELQAIQVANKEQQEELYSEMRNMKLQHRRDKQTLEQRNKVLKHDLRIFKISNTKLKRKLDTKVKELQAIKFANKKLQVEHYAETQDMQGREMEIPVERNKRKRKLDTKEKTEEEPPAAKRRVAENIMQLAGNSCAPLYQHQTQTGGISDEEKDSLNGFELIRTVGEGGFGTVVLAKKELPGGSEQLCAIKALRKTGLNSISMAMDETKAMMLASGHPFIVTLHSCLQSKAHFFLVMDYLSEGNLAQQLEVAGKFSEARTQFYAAEITVALQYLHNNGILHRDLKLDNVLVGSDGHCKITDFGVAKTGFFHDRKANTNCGTPFCIAPEVVLNLPYGRGVDWWALGIMMYEMLVGCAPFGYQNDDHQKEKTGGGQEEGDFPRVLNSPCWTPVDMMYGMFGLVKSALFFYKKRGGEEDLDARLDYRITHYEVDYPEDLSPDAVSIIRELLMKDPDKRLGADGSMDTIRNHPFFRGIDWQALEEKRVEPPEMRAKIGERGKLDWQIVK